MAVHFCVLLILSGLTGIHSITTVRDVPVKAGDSVSIPCLYGSQYRDHVKYLCHGYAWSFCSYAVKTNQRSSGKFSISDDRDQRLFTVTIKDVTDQDTDYWCAVEINQGSDVGEYFHLSVTRGTPSLRVERREMRAFEEDNITINCYHSISGEMKWCRLGSSCLRESGSIDDTRVTINASVPGVFSVTMSELTTESSGWYWCVKGDLQVPVQVTVTEKPTTTVTASSSLTTLLATSEPMSDMMSDLTNFVIPLSVLVVTVTVALFIWFMLRRRKQTTVESSATTMAEQEVTFNIVERNRKTLGQAEEDVIYSDVKHVRKTPGQRLDAESKSNVEVIYSSVVAV